MNNASELIVELPRKLNFYTINQLLSKLHDNPIDKHDVVIFDFCKIEFIEPKGITFLTNLMNKMKNIGVKHLIRHYPYEENQGKNHEAMLYLRDSGFFSTNGFKSFYGAENIRATALPISKIDTDKVDQWNDLVFLDYLRKQTGKNKEFSHLRVAADEIFNNITDHSTEKIGCCFAQFYPRNNEIQISFSDFGIGIPTSLKNNWNKVDKKLINDINLNDLSDSDLLEIAIKEGISTKAKPGNRGVGLWHIIRSLTNDGIGVVYIRSNKGEIWLEDKKVKNKRDSVSNFPGTFFEIMLNTANDSLYDSELEEEFEW